MRKKGFVLRNLNARALKSAVFSTISIFKPLRDYLNYYQDMECFELRAQKGSLRSLEIRPVEEYSIRFSEAEISDILRDRDTSSDALRLLYKMARIDDVTVLGSSGVTVCNQSGSKDDEQYIGHAEEVSQVEFAGGGKKHPTQNCGSDQACQCTDQGLGRAGCFLSGQQEDGQFDAFAENCQEGKQRTPNSELESL